MKKFIILSVLVAIAGIAIGVTRRQESSPVAVVAASEPTTAPTTAPTVAPVTPQVAAKPAVKKTTPASARAVVATTSTTTRPATTTTSPVTAILGTPTSSTTPTTRFKPACTLTVEKSTVAPGGDQVVRLISNMPHVQAQIRFGKWVQTDSSGAASWQIKAPTTPGAISVTTAFMLAPGQFIGSVCSSSFTVTA